MKQFAQFALAAAAVFGVTVLACTPNTGPGVTTTPSPGASSTAATASATPAATASTAVTTSSELFPAVSGDPGELQVNSKYVGAETCKVCHSTIFEKFSDTGHWNPRQRDAAMTRDGSFLRKNRSGKPAPEGQFGNYLANKAECRSCHVVGDASHFDDDKLEVVQAPVKLADGTIAGFDFDKEASDSYNVKFVGIQCESCHGPGANHVSAAAADKKKAITKTPSYKKTCIACHNKDPRREWTASGAADKVVNKGGTSNYAPHPQVLVYGEGGGYHFGQTLPTSTHAKKLGNGCVNCHVYGSAPDNHSIAIWLDRDKFIPNCQKCHGSTFKKENILSYQVGFRMANKELYDTLKAYKKGFCKKVIVGTNKTVSTASADVENPSNYCSEWDDSPTAVTSATLATGSAITGDSGTWSTHMTTYNGAYWNYRLLDGENSDGIHSPAYEQALLRLSFNKLATDLNTLPPTGSYTILRLK